ncbi:MTH1187 family thiamine-binding protein [Nesterenkonia pannonica]|uniref:MTH1187 family thiamine-binding protein n=1 Tax=Nesterenkonia pannonica TaxID=1548602 RepID=UPI00216451AD|nr:MTH1187 family thiamine-binding protein [Nesterenkonia pannonica]
MLAAFSVAPDSASASDDGSVSDAVSAAVKVVKQSGLPYELTSMFTTIEGEWDEVFSVIRQATDAVVAVSPRVSLVVKADIRPGYTNQLRDKVEACGAEAGRIAPAGLSPRWWRWCRRP